MIRSRSLSGGSAHRNLFIEPKPFIHPMKIEELTEDQLHVERKKLREALQYGSWRFGKRWGEQPVMLKRLRAIESRLNILRDGEDILY